jgi:hypothetical protein
MILWVTAGLGDGDERRKLGRHWGEITKQSQIIEQNEAFSLNAMASDRAVVKVARHTRRTGGGAESAFDAPAISRAGEK